MIRRRNILSETNNCQLKCPAWNKTLVEKETNSRHSDESQNPLNDEIAGRTRNDDRMYFRPDKFTKLRKKPFFVIASEAKQSKYSEHSILLYLSGSQ